MQKRFVIGVFFYLFLAGMFLACSSSEERGEVIVEAFGDKLYTKDLEGIIPEGLSPQDSNVLVKNYVNQWIELKVLLEKARKNIDTTHFAKQLEDYKNSLIIYEYEQQVVNQLLDTLVTEGELKDYYDRNSANFLLKDNIVKVLYVKLDKKSQGIRAVKSLLFKPNLSEADKLSLQKEVYNSAVNFYLDDQTWLLFNDLLKEVPIETYNQELFLKNNRNINIEDGSFVYLARIVDFKIKESLSPFSMEKENIRDIIINKRKVDIITKMHQDLLQEAETDKNTKIYIQ